eukprot:3644078-Amphidinium_carterae.1
MLAKHISTDTFSNHQPTRYEASAVYVWCSLLILIPRLRTSDSLWMNPDQLVCGGDVELWRPCDPCRT